MPTSQLEHEYDSIASEFGRRIANRWIYATATKAGKTDFTQADFYAMYGSEARLPESERTRSDDALMLDVTGWNDFYRRDEGQHFIDAAIGMQGTTRDWIAELNAATDAQYSYLRALVLGHALWENADEEWRAFEATTNNVDAFVLFVLFERRWPRVDGDARTGHPNEAQIARDLGVRDLPDTRSAENRIA
ncbi:hypothetical protein B0G80_0241 [Paraburkholderia sp. BL6669N2]|uniref:hypothetical protein n=1 Tax=Paraburkholderia sp. BL6669N2 TaxID=1938807 RepID=UPI000E269C6A|nr:hypothetical protein [Paraburkholderia sp. BL6669N2]REG57617.1 hypothetical protein B0G80_0241 [Paraburkholderia sp. BL6669N2]